MATKTFKIGEYCKGGIITAETRGAQVTIIGKEWDFSAGSSRGSDQSRAKEFTRLTFDTRNQEGVNLMYAYLTDLTTHHYAEQVLKWAEGQVKPVSRWHY